MLKYLTTAVVAGTLIGSAISKILDPTQKVQAKEKKEDKAKRKQRRKEYEKKRKKDEKILFTANLLTTVSVTCRCGGLAVPTEKQGKIRKCVRCNVQFVSSNYNLGGTRPAHESNSAPFFLYDGLNMNYYDDAVRLLKTR